MSTTTVRRTSSRVAWIAFIAAIACLAIYILACVMSPPAWSPDSSKIAILVSPSGDEPDRFALFVYDMAADTHTLLDEVKAEGILSAPSWSPDGKWIAYYRVEQPLEEAAPSDANVAEPNRTRDKTRTSAGPEGATETGAPLFSEDDLILPAITSELLEKKIDETDHAETFDVKLVVVSPDGRERRVLSTMRWIDNDDDEMLLMLLYSRPVWFPDSRRLLYVRGLEDVFYVGSFDLTTGQTRAHMLSSISTPVLSHDGEWIASCMGEDADTVVAARVDGSFTTYLRLGFEIDQDLMRLSDGMFWSGDSKRLFVVAEDTALHAVDLATGAAKPWIVPDPNHTNAYYTQSPARDRLYFITGREAEDEGSQLQTLTLRYTNLQDRTTGSLFTFALPELSDSDEGGRFSISPDGKTVLVRAVVDDAFGQEKSALIFFDGKTKRVIKTDQWLLKPLYGDADLVFDDRLIGEWSGEDCRVSIAKGAREKTYDLRWIEDGEQRRAAANLVRLKNATFLALFTDESSSDKDSTSGSPLLPDIFAGVVQIEPTLILRSIPYDELAEALQQTTDSIRLEDLGDEHTAEFERVKQ